MTDLITSVALVFAATFVPLVVGSVLGILLSERVPKAAIAAASLGVLTWIFIDLMQDAAVLDVAQGFGGGIPQLALVCGFVGTLSALILLDKGFSEKAAIPFSAALLAAVALGLHSAGEGIDMGSGFATLGLNSFLGSQAAAFLLHKALEGFALSSFLVLSSGGAKFRDAFRLSLIVGLMAGIAAPLGYYSALSSAYLLALGAGGDVYLIFRLAPNAFDARARFKLALSFVVGFLLIYFAALLHS